MVSGAAVVISGRHRIRATGLCLRRRLSSPGVLRRSTRCGWRSTAHGELSLPRLSKLFGLTPFQAAVPGHLPGAGGRTANELCLPSRRRHR